MYRGPMYWWWSVYDSIGSGKEPRFAITAMHREGRPWWVCPRNPFVEGWKFDLSAFFSKERRWSDSPNLMISLAMYYGFLNACFKSTHDIYALPETHGVKQQNVRLGHVWAMKRLGYVRVLRGIIVPGMIGASYAVPKEVFSQNTLRRNRRNACDLAPHAVGLTGLFASTAQLYYSANILQYWFVFSVVSTLFVWIDSRAHTAMNSVKEFAYPQLLAQIHGMPFGGEGFDFPAGGEMSTQYRLESEVERGLQQQTFKINQPVMGDDFPMFEMDWGHSTFTM